MPRDETPARQTPARWVSRNHAARLAEVDPRSLPRIADRIGVRTRDIPGERRRYLRSDVVRLLSPEPEPAASG